MLFFPAAYAFIRNNDNELEPTTIKTYFWNLKKLEYFRPGLQCEEIDKAFIHSYKAHLQEQGNKPATVNKALSVFRIFLNKLIANGFKMDNPFAGFRPLPRGRRRSRVPSRPSKSLLPENSHFNCSNL